MKKINKIIKIFPFFLLAAGALTLLHWKPALLTAPKFAGERDGMGGGGSFQGEGLVIWAGSGDSEKINKKIKIFTFTFFFSAAGFRSCDS